MRILSALALSSGEAGWLRPGRVLALSFGLLSWIIPLAFLVWAARLAFLQAYYYEIDKDFLGDFTRTATLGAPHLVDRPGHLRWTDFVYRFLIEPDRMFRWRLRPPSISCCSVSRSRASGWRSSACGGRGWRFFVLAAWLGHHMSVEAFANTAHLEVLELTLVSLGAAARDARKPLWKQHRARAGGRDQNPASSVPAVSGADSPQAHARRGRRLGRSGLPGGVLAARYFSVGRPVLVVYQGGNLTKLEYTEYE